jgi:putative nucleotidyltransferase with HDIG domain
MALPSREEARAQLEKHVADAYQRHHATMVATAMEGYAETYGEDRDLWYVTGLLHDIDFEEHPHAHPGESLKWFREWAYPEELIHAVEAHAYGYNGFTTLPRSRLASALIACDEMCGIFYAYRQINPIPYGEMKAGSIRKRYGEARFAAKIDRKVIDRGCEALGVPLDEHIAKMIKFLSRLDGTS